MAVVSFPGRSIVRLTPFAPVRFAHLHGSSHALRSNQAVAVLEQPHSFADKFVRLAGDERIGRIRSVVIRQNSSFGIEGIASPHGDNGPANVSSLLAVDQARQLAGHGSHVERLPQQANILKFGFDRACVITGGEDEWYPSGLEYARKREDHLGSQVDVDDRGVNGTVTVDDRGGFLELTERADNPSAKRLQRPYDVVGEKILVFHHKHAASRQRSWTGWLERHLSTRSMVTGLL